ncbi:P-loop containing nucleoside triphosphate hydrolase protein [Infundibulicybe gibba]|nr:P-loop containing nucleoside triphosphate hydrolase protein [Infundibulicybe gibba]
MTLLHISKPVLPIPPSWFPGHMMKFTRMLPALLTRTDVVLELRDSRLPLTSINRTLEGALKKWRMERGWDPNNPKRRIVNAGACERIVVLNKRDLVPEWGMEPFRKAMESKFPDQRVLFASWQRPRDIRNLSELLVSIAKRHPHAMELNVLVIGMPNVGKSTLLNALRNMGIKGRTPKAFQTSAQPGLTQALSTRLKVSLDPLVYAFDTPGVMLPFLGRGTEGAERGVKLALIAGIKEGLYDTEALAAYLLYRLNILNPISPAYLQLLPAGARPTNQLEEFLALLAQRMGMLKRGAEVDLSRAAVYFVRWWREEGGLLAASSALQSTDTPQLPAGVPIGQGWGFDFQWQLTPDDVAADMDSSKMIQSKMEVCIDEYIETTDREDREDNNISPTQQKKQMVLQEKMKRKLKHAKR